MAGPASIVRTIHLLQLRIQDLEEKLARLPRQIQTQHNKVSYQEKVLEERKEELAQARSDNSDRERELKDLHQAIEKYERQRRQASTTKEMNALGTEIEHATERIAQLEEAVLLGLEEIEEKIPTIPEQEAVVARVKKERDEFLATTEERETSMRELLESSKQELSEAEQQLPGTLRSTYDRLTKSMGIHSLSPAVEGACQACSIEITPQNQSDLLKENAVICKSCGRILYLPSADAITENS